MRTANLRLPIQGPIVRAGHTRMKAIEYNVIHNKGELQLLNPPVIKSSFQKQPGPHFITPTPPLYKPDQTCMARCIRKPYEKHIKAKESMARHSKAEQSDGKPLPKHRTSMEKQ